MEIDLTSKDQALNIANLGSPNFKSSHKLVSQPVIALISPPCNPALRERYLKKTLSEKTKEDNGGSFSQKACPGSL